VDVQAQTKRIIVDASEAGKNLLQVLDKQHVRIISVETEYDYATPRKVDSTTLSPRKSDLGMCTRIQKVIPFKDLAGKKTYMIESVDGKRKISGARNNSPARLNLSSSNFGFFFGGDREEQLEMAREESKSRSDDKPTTTDIPSGNEVGGKRKRFDDGDFVGEVAKRATRNSLDLPGDSSFSTLGNRRSIRPPRPLTKFVRPSEHYGEYVSKYF
jgi:hypothetical protein